jgi:hypothetical protein
MCVPTVTRVPAAVLYVQLIALLLVTSVACESGFRIRTTDGVHAIVRYRCEEWLCENSEHKIPTQNSGCYKIKIEVDVV